MKKFLNLFRKKIAIQRFGAVSSGIGRTALLRKNETRRQEL